jgi:hypothetical protein
MSGRIGGSAGHSDRTFRARRESNKAPRWTAGQVDCRLHARAACSTDFWVGDDLGAGLADLALERPRRPAHFAQSVLPRCHQFQPHWDSAFGACRRVWGRACLSMARLCRQGLGGAYRRCSRATWRLAVKSAAVKAKPNTKSETQRKSPNFIELPRLVRLLELSDLFDQPPSRPDLDQVPHLGQTFGR